MKSIKENILIDYEKIKNVIELRSNKQLGTLQEESAEMIAAMVNLLETITQWLIAKKQSYKFFVIEQSLYNNIVEEMADVYITIENVKTLLNISDKSVNQLFSCKEILPQGKINSELLDPIQTEAKEFIKNLAMLIQAIAKWTRVISGDNYLIKETVYKNIVAQMAIVYGSLANMKTLLNISEDEINAQIIYKQNKLARKIEKGEITA